MTLYWTDKRTGEMIPVLKGLHQKPRRKVRRKHRADEVLSIFALAFSGLFLAASLMALTLR